MSSRGRQGRKRRKKSGRRKLLRRIWTLVFVLAVIAAGLAAGWYFLMPKAVKELTVEAGSPCPVLADFVEREPDKAKLVSGLGDSVDMNTVADYEVVIEIYGRESVSVLHVVDTTAPVVTVQDVHLYSALEAAPSDFIAAVDDATATTAEFVSKPDFTLEGSREVQLSVSDEGGNTTIVTANLEIVFDTEPPVIEGIRELTAVVGGSVSYKSGVTVTDDHDRDVKLEVDNSAVDLNKVGDYTVIYRAFDAAGNVTEKSTVLHVTEPSMEDVSETTVNYAADKILAKLTNDGMSQYETAKAIYWWAHENIAYVDGSNKDDWVRAAYDGLIGRRGDCYVYAMASKVLLTRAGITNMDIEKIPANNTLHYWNLIDIGEGWHHFDTTRRADGATFFYLTDAELMTYSDSHNGTHNYDRSKYPAIP